MKIITSKDNTAYKNALKLTRKKYRDETGTYLLEGIKPLEDALNTGVKVNDIFVREDLGDTARTFGDGVSLLGRDLFKKLSSTETSQGVIAVARKRVYGAEEFADRTKNGRLLIIDRLQDPGNIGTVIRTAEAAGYSGVIAVKGSGDVYSPKAVRAAAGSLFRMPVISVDVDEAITLAVSAGHRLAVTCLDGAEDCFTADISGNIALVIGNEGRGVSARFMEEADVKVKIPMAGSIESLNAAVAAGILMYLSGRIK